MVPRDVITNPLFIAVLFALCATVIYQGRIATALGAFLACASWDYNVDVGPLTMFRLLAGTLFCAAVVASIRKRTPVGKTFIAPQVIRTVFLVVAWTLWIALKTALSASQTDHDIFVSFLTFTVCATLLMLLYINNLAAIREMVLSFVLCSFAAAASSLIIFLRDLGQPGNWIRGPSEVNYLTFSWELAIAALFGLGLLLTVKSGLQKLILLAMVSMCSIVMLMTGARQTAIGLAVSLGYIAWAVRRERGKAMPVLLMVVTIVALAAGAYFYANQAATGADFLVAKWSVTGDDAGIRQHYWQAGWAIFLDHPLAGSGLTYLSGGDSAHNLIIDLLASQGLVGFLFMTAFAAFTYRACAGMPLSAITNEERTWRVIFLATILFIALHSFASGSVLGEPEFFWVPFLVMQLAAIAAQRGLKASCPSFSANLQGNPLETSPADANASTPGI
jgi:O-antigen ligase